MWLRWVESPALLSIPSAHTQAHTKSDIVQALTPFLWFAFIFSLRMERVYTKGGFAAGPPAAFAPSFPFSVAVAHSRSESRPRSCSPQLGLEESSSSSGLGVLWVTSPDAADLGGAAGRSACSLPASLRLAPRAFAPFRRVGWDWLIFWS